jgi:hypothetical protein
MKKLHKAMAEIPAGESDVERNEGQRGQIVTRQAQTGQEIDSRIYAPVLEQKV